ncbi:hypothetical protein J6590_059319 [Homalodisca vitripennis]|nr:hypothetical protein J6590_059319 [Homalodisca vitripennis]
MMAQVAGARRNRWLSHHDWRIRVPNADAGERVRCCDRDVDCELMEARKQQLQVLELLKRTREWPWRTPGI